MSDSRPRIRITYLGLLLPLFLAACGGTGADGGSENKSVGVGDSSIPLTGDYALLAWNDLGMHCMDGKDYSVFSILPPYNNLIAQLVDRRTGGTVSEGVTLTYQAAFDGSGSINSYSAGKVNFWRYAAQLYGAPPTLPDDMGLAGFPMASATPAALEWNPTHDWHEAEGIPITPYDDSMRKRYYPMVEVVARADAGGERLASVRVVLPVSDEMSCRSCHASGSGSAARPAGGWVSDPDPERDWKRNILRLHDERKSTDLLASADGGTPVLCASCHGSNALPGTGTPGVSPLTRAVHARHATVIDPASGRTLDAVDNRSACYACHPGSETKCLRGAMGNATDTGGNDLMTCQGCHGNMTAVGSADREGWLQEPTCQACHFDAERRLTVFDAGGQMREPSDRRFATDPDTPAAGYSLYRFSTGHGGIQCEGCHGATHAVYPSAETNDNELAESLQGHAGTITECEVCHRSVPFTADRGPHGMHTTGNRWVSGHEDIAERDHLQCAYCHGSDYRGTALSETKVPRSFRVEDRARSFPAGHRFGCYDCHNGPNGGEGGD